MLLYGSRDLNSNPYTPATKILSSKASVRSQWIHFAISLQSVVAFSYGIFRQNLLLLPLLTPSLPIAPLTPFHPRDLCGTLMWHASYCPVPSPTLPAPLSSPFQLCGMSLCSHLCKVSREPKLTQKSKVTRKDPERIPSGVEIAQLMPRIQHSQGGGRAEAGGQRLLPGVAYEGNFWRRRIWHLSRRTVGE